MSFFAFKGTDSEPDAVNTSNVWEGTASYNEEDGKAFMKKLNKNIIARHISFYHVIAALILFDLLLLHIILYNVDHSLDFCFIYSLMFLQMA